LIDGKSMLAFFTGKADRSPREFFPVFVGDDLYAVKWRNWKAHFILQETKYSPKQVFSTAPRVVNLLQDPREERQVAEPYNSWVQYPGMANLVKFQQSQRLQPHVPVGAPDDFVPPPLKTP
jgi:arylsulfatase